MGHRFTAREVVLTAFVTINLANRIRDLLIKICRNTINILSSGDGYPSILSFLDALKFVSCVLEPTTSLINKIKSNYQFKGFNQSTLTAQLLKEFSISVF